MEAPPVQAALAEPHPGAVPDEQFEPCARSVGERPGAALIGRMTQMMLYMTGEAFHAPAHVDRFDGQKDLFRAIHARLVLPRVSSRWIGDSPGDSISSTGTKAAGVEGSKEVSADRALRRDAG